MAFMWQAGRLARRYVRTSRQHPQLCTCFQSAEVLVPKHHRLTEPNRREELVLTNWLENPIRNRTDVWLSVAGPGRVSASDDVTLSSYTPHSHTVAHSEIKYSFI